jgi:ATP-dependent helicase/nuclease subunit B
MPTEAISAPGRHRLVDLPTLLLDVPISNEAELAFVTALAGAAPTTLATVPAADLPTLGRFRDRLGFKVEDLDQPPVAGNPSRASTGALARLQRHLFNEHEMPPEGKAGNEIEVFSAPGEGRECVEIVRRVLALAREAVPFDGIAVLLRSPEDYRAHLKEAFSRAEIPVHFARGAVRPDPAGRAFYTLPECAAEGLSARKFAEYLSLSQVPDAATGGAPPEPRSRGDLWIAPDPELVPPLASENASDSIASPEGNAATQPPPDAPVRDGQLRAPRRCASIHMRRRGQVRITASCTSTIGRPARSVPVTNRRARGPANRDTILRCRGSRGILARARVSSLPSPGVTSRRKSWRAASDRPLRAH